ncbi:hypothetical protein BD413DRAFT_617569 [Trametes elegans]|nr:hypothetical protein BD413DRAFT_617569 [Trametes elegans]
MFSTKFVAVFVTLLAATATASAAEANNARGLVRPDGSGILSPVAQDVWYVGDQASVKWAIPADNASANFRVDIQLGYELANSNDGHWDEFAPLATNVNFNDAAVIVTVPDVQPMGVYKVRVGSSPEFTSQKFLIKPARN